MFVSFSNLQNASVMASVLRQCWFDRRQEWNPDYKSLIKQSAERFTYCDV